MISVCKNLSFQSKLALQVWASIDMLRRDIDSLMNGANAEMLELLTYVGWLFNYIGFVDFDVQFSDFFYEKYDVFSTNKKVSFIS